MVHRPSSILAVHPGALGDVVLFGRVLGRLGGRVTLVAGREKGELLVGLGAAEAALDFDALPMHEVFAETPVPQCRLPALLGRHDRLVSCFAGGDRSAAGRRAGLRLTAFCGAADAAFLPVRPPEGFSGHLLDTWSDLLGLCCETGRRAAWPVPRAWRSAARGALRDAGAQPRRPYLVVHPGSGGRTKCWPLERFMELGATVFVRSAARAKELVRSPAAHRAGMRTVFVLGPVECEKWEGRAVGALRREFPTLVCPPLAVLAGVLAGAAAYVGNDSGVTHLAAAVGTHTVALFGPTRAEHFAPVGRAVRVISARSLDDIPVHRVRAALERG